MKNIFTITIILACLNCFTTKAATNKKEFYSYTTEDVNVTINYPNPICTSSGLVDVIMTGSGNYLGGTFSSMVGLFLNPVTGQIAPYISAPGTYMVTYTLSPGPDNPGITTTTIVTISPQVFPTFAATTTICFGSIAPILPSVSNEGIVGTWLPSTISNTTSATYTFTPNPGQCAASTIINIEVIQTNAVIITENGSNTVYVDEITNDVVAALVLSCQTTSGDYTYQWFEDGVLITGATMSTYTISTATVNGEDRIFTVEVTHIGTDCSVVSTEFVVHQSSGTPLPRGTINQTLPPGSTLADVVVLGSNIQWYLNATNKNSMVNALPLSTVLVDNTTYYASQTINGEESLERLPITVHLTLGIDENKPVSFIFSPNPAKNIMTMVARQDLRISCLRIYNTLGQLVQVNTNPNETIDVSGLQSGSYFIQIISDKGSSTGRFIKE